MDAKFEIKVSIEDNNVSTSFGAERINDLDTSLFTQLLKIFGDVHKKVKTQIDKYYEDTPEEAKSEGEGEDNPE